MKLLSILNYFTIYDLIFLYLQKILTWNYKKMFQESITIVSFYNFQKIYEKIDSTISLKCKVVSRKSNMNEMNLIPQFVGNCWTSWQSTC